MRTGTTLQQAEFDLAEADEVIEEIVRLLATLVEARDYAQIIRFSEGLHEMLTIRRYLADDVQRLRQGGREAVTGGAQRSPARTLPLQPPSAAAPRAQVATLTQSEGDGIL